MASRWAHALMERQSGAGDGTMNGAFDNNNAANYNGDDDYDDDYSWWWSPTGMAVRYTIIVLLFAGIVLFFLGGYYHAQRRIRRGLPPKPYHAWMVRRAYRSSPHYNPYYGQHPYQYGPPQQEGYPMTSYPQAGGAFAAPPPAYNPYTAPPPSYQPPEGASKAMADQHFHGVVHREGQSSVTDRPLPTERPLPPLGMGPLPPAPTGHQ